MSVPHLFRITIPVGDIEAAAAFYARLLGTPGERVHVNRHYFQCGEVILACVEPPGDQAKYRPEDDQRILYFAVEDIEGAFERARQAGAPYVDEKIATQPWGEQSFFADDPFGNPLCFVKEGTRYTGGGRRA
jgi:predicted enzyme related to lactoylglutathione lyase